MVCPAHGELPDDDDDDEEDNPQPTDVPQLPPTFPAKKKAKAVETPGTQVDVVAQADEVVRRYGQRVPAGLEHRAIRALNGLIQENDGRSGTYGGLPPVWTPEYQHIIENIVRELRVSEMIAVVREFQNVAPTRESHLADAVNRILAFAEDPQVVPPPGLIPRPGGVVGGVPSPGTGRPGGGGGTAPAFFDPDAGHSILPGARGAPYRSDDLRRTQAAALARAKSDDSRLKSQFQTGPGSTVTFKDNQGRTLTVYRPKTRFNASIRAKKTGNKARRARRQKRNA